MTCIAAIKHKGKVYIGGDSAGVGGLGLTLRADEKVFRNGLFIFGFTSSFRMGQLLRYKFSPPRQKLKQSDVEYMSTDFVDAVRKCLKDGGYAKVKENAETGGIFIVGYKGNIYTIEADYQVAIPLQDYAACGCGDDLAIGALYALKESKLSAKRKLIVALSAAESGSAGVRSPFKIVSK